MIEIKNLHKSYGKFHALNDVSLVFQKSHCYALIGPNGSGKTTLIKSILRLVIPNAGAIIIEGKPCGNDPEFRRLIGYMPQNPRFPDSMSVKQIIAMMKDIRGVHEPDEDLIRHFRIHELSEKKLGALSGGTKQKVNAALAFLFSPQILILDEPTAGLDPLSTEILKDKILLEKQRGKLILITSHILSDLDELASDLIYMQDGGVVLQKNTDVLRMETGETSLTKAVASFMKQLDAVIDSI